MSEISSNTNKYLGILGRQPKISLAELEAVFGSHNVEQIDHELALITTSQTPDVQRLGGTQKIARVLDRSPLDYLFSLPHGKLTIGISDYRRHATKATAQNEALKLKKQLVREGYSARIIPNQSAILSTATSHHNKLGLSLNKIELIYDDRFTAISIGAQNITAYARRDQARPARDARVGMLPPKLAQILINLAANGKPDGRILDPFCGTGVVLQESLLMGYSAYGTDLEPRMIEMSQKNLDWLLQGRNGSHTRDFANRDNEDEIRGRYPRRTSAVTTRTRTTEPRDGGREGVVREGNVKDFVLEVGDAETHQWTGEITAVATETYLGQAFSAPPSDAKLREVKHVTKAIITGFLKNIHPQIDKGTQLALAIPAWRRPDGRYEHLKILDELDRLGYNVVKYRNLESSDLLYHREDQIVAREILVLRSK